MAQWDFEHPGRGDTGSVFASSEKLQSSANDVSDARRAVMGARDEVTPAIWEGAAQPVWVANVQAAVDSMQLFWSSLTSVKTAVYNYGALVEGIEIRAKLARSNLHDAQTVIDNLPSEYPDHYWEPEKTPQQIELIQRTRGEAMHRKSKAERDLTDLGTERTTTDNNLIGHIQKALPASWNDQRTALAAIGIHSAGDLKDKGLRRAIADIAARVSTGGNLSDTDVAAIGAYLDLYAGDEEELSKFYREIGGDATVQLVQSLGEKIGPMDYDNAGVLAIAQKIRSTLSLGSANWTQEQAAAFGESAMYGNPPSDANVFGNIQGLGWLFADAQNNPMGEQLAVDLANRVNDWELTRDKGALVWPSPLDSEGAGASRLYAYEFAGDGWAVQPVFFGGGRDAGADGNGISSNDLAGRVFETLGQYPDSALEFLESGDLEFRDYWFDKRDWSGADQFEGPAALWNGAQHVEGGPMGDAASADPAVQERLALLSSRIMWQLDQNDNFSWENVSNDAAAEFARTLTPYLGGFAEYMYAGGSYEDDEPGTVPLTLFGEDSPTPRVNENTLAHFFGTLGGRPAGALTLQDAAYIYQDQYLLDSRNGGQSMQEALLRYNALQASLDGAGIGATLNGAERADALTDQQMDAFLTAAGMVPIPGPAIVGSMASFIESVGGSAINGGMHTYDETFARMALKEDSLEIASDFRNALAAYKVFQDGDTPAPPVLDSLSDADSDKAIKAWLNQVVPELEQNSSSTVNTTVDVSVLSAAYRVRLEASKGWAVEAGA